MKKKTKKLNLNKLKNYLNLQKKIKIKIHF